MNNSDIIQMINKMDKEYNSIKKECLTITVHTNMSYNETIMLTYDDKVLLAEIIKEKVDAQKNTTTIPG